MQCYNPGYILYDQGALHAIDDDVEQGLWAQDDRVGFRDWAVQMLQNPDLLVQVVLGSIEALTDDLHPEGGGDALPLHPLEPRCAILMRNITNRKEDAMATIGRDTTISWLGHGTFHIATPGGKRLLIDPWIDSNPACPDAWKQRIRAEGLDAILVTHGHFDHIAELLELSTVTDAKIVCMFDLVAWLTAKGVGEERIVGFNKGGTVTVAGVRITMTKAEHSSSFNDNGTIVPLGEAVGYVLRLENGFTIYHTGDTAVTYDMLIIGDLYQPDVTILPIGDYFTMDPRQAAYALKLIRSKYAIPGHFGTFPILSGTPEQLREHTREFGVHTEVIGLKPGESVD